VSVSSYSPDIFLNGRSSSPKISVKTVCFPAEVRNRNPQIPSHKYYCLSQHSHRSTADITKYTGHLQFVRGTEI
jgi:hypothetical protein